MTKRHVRAPVPDDLKQFILDSIDCVVQLEALLLLRAHPTLRWDAGAIAGRLYVTVEETMPWLERLCSQGFLQSDNQSVPQYQYKPRSAEIGQMVDRLAQVYARHLVAVTQLIHSKPRSRVQEFAEAFRLRKD
jgi:hypothetical protein